MRNDGEDLLGDPYKELLDMSDCNCGVVKTGSDPLPEKDDGNIYLGICARHPSRMIKRMDTRIFMALNFFF